MKKIKSVLKVLLISVSCVFLLIPTATKQTRAETPVNQKADADVSRHLIIAVPDYSKITDEQADQLSEQISNQQRELRLLLLSQLRRGDLSNGAKSEVIKLLGVLHAYEAIPILIENINFYDDRPYPDPTLRAQIRRGHVARAALEVMGRPASEAVLSIIAAKPPEDPQYPTAFDKSKVDGFVEVLYQIEGERYALLKLQDRQAASNDPVVKAQYQMVIDRFKEIVSHINGSDRISE
jgi:hypothetical protein